MSVFLSKVSGSIRVIWIPSPIQTNRHESGVRYQSITLYNRFFEVTVYVYKKCIGIFNTLCFPLQKLIKKNLACIVSQTSFVYIRLIRNAQRKEAERPINVHFEISLFAIKFQWYYASYDIVLAINHECVLTYRWYYCFV